LYSRLILKYGAVFYTVVKPSRDRCSQRIAISITFVKQRMDFRLNLLTRKAVIGGPNSILHMTYPIDRGGFDQVGACSVNRIEVRYWKDDCRSAAM